MSRGKPNKVACCATENNFDRFWLRQFYSFSKSTKNILKQYYGQVRAWKFPLKWNGDTKNLGFSLKLAAFWRFESYADLPDM